MSNNAKQHLIIALDVDSLSAAERIVRETKEFCATYKVGLELFSACGPAAIDMVKQHDAHVFLDLKLHDIPNTVAAALKQAHHHGATFSTVHALGGPQMLKHAVDATLSTPAMMPLKLLAVSVLTHHSDSELQAMGFNKSSTELVIDWLRPAYDAGFSGCICSPQEAASVRQAFGPDFVIVCPGIRPMGSSKNDQSRIATPMMAIKNGANYLVVGRPITQTENLNHAAKLIVKEIEDGLHANT